MNVDLESLKIFVKVAELGSFTRAGEHLGMPKARVSLRLKALEAELGTRLLQRTTRVVRLTPDGEELLPRARRLALEADEIGGMFQAARALRGRVRIDLPVNFARDIIIPRLPELLARHPGLEVLISTTDRRVEPLREGFDCVLRIGDPGDPGLVGRRLGVLRMINCASPSYLREHGTPRRIEDLDRHLVVHYSSTLGAEAPSFEYPCDGGYRERPMRSVVTVNSADAYRAACIAGLGIIQAPRTGMLASIAAGALVEVLPALPCAPMPVSLLHTHGRSAPRRVRAVMSWITEVLSPHLAAPDG
ncbi:LysR family transcriptional regulator [Sorangium cellulosum]|uniref:LysR family transcriptional regulator n=1 Tax=Sorangium cellulosum TaxID=56 RepID=A0A2L0F4P4_SORCE|nr:LysR family transcriptional regulator [Sorangium cellulosum]AUX46419.1 LysR family transcriptional regulator [Sorangium cellulosum]